MTTGAHPQARIVASVPVTHPSHWSHHRPPRDDQERDELAAQTLGVDGRLERLLVMRDQAPDAFAAQVLEVAVEVDHYERQRERAIRGGLAIPEPTDELVAEVRAAAAEWRATDRIPVEVRNVDADHRPRFAAAVREGNFAAAVEAFAAWLVAVDAAEAFMARRADARSALGLAAGMSPLARPSFLVETEMAVGGRRVVR